MRVEVACGRGERALIEGLLQFYMYDFSAFEPPQSSRLDFDSRGGLGAFPGLKETWDAPGFHPLLIHADGKVAGFAWVDRRSHLSEGPAERNLGEFFVARKFRRRGVATAAARAIFEAHPGRWEVAVMAANTPALAFWPRAVAATPAARDVVRHEGDGVRWTGPVWTFEVGGA